MVFRPRRARLVVHAIALVLVAFAVTTAVLMPGGPIYSYVWRVTVPVVTGTIVLVLIMMARPKAVALPEGLKVVNLWRAETFAWTEIIAVRFAKDAPWASLDVADGRNVPVMAIQNTDGALARADAQRLADLVASRGEPQ